ncbi:spore germination protein [Paenibacillus sp. FSL H8-0034]|uniref:spore germination protein n=1 Tax=Paenibacillus sp. FSL H8-0034 TaxID=2954671 RepID=UPI0030F9A4A6
MKLWKLFSMPFKKTIAHGEKTDSNSVTQFVDLSLVKNESWALLTFAGCQDVKIQKMIMNAEYNISSLLIYCEGIVDTKQINETIIPSLHDWLKEVDSQPLTEDTILLGWSMSTLHKETILDHIVTKVFDGELILFFEGVKSAFIINIAKPPTRNPEESNSEISIRGPRDGFIEDISVNVALVRKRLRTKSLSYEQFTLGKRSQTKAGLLYIKDIIQPKIVEEAKARLSSIDTDAVYSSNELEELLSESKFSLIPLFDYTGRPDYVVSSLLRGRFAIILDGVPTAIIAPANLMLLVKTAEDIHNSYSNITFGRILRLFGLCISLFLPGFYIAITTYHQDQIPLTLLATLVTSRKGVPFPTPIEAFVMLVLFELFREAGMRLPSAVGQTLAVVGGLIIGEAAIRAGLTSPSLLVVIAATLVSTFTLVNQSLAGGVSIIRLGILLISSFLGIFGFFLSIFVLLISLANLKSFGIPFLAPISPITWRDVTASLVRLPASFQNKRPKMLNVQDSTRERSKK